LTNKQKAFINEYLQCWNATEAAKRAGYSEKTAYSIGQRLLKDVEVAKEIDIRLSEMRMSADEVLHRLSQIARNEITQHITNYGAIIAVDMEAIREAGLLHLVQEISNTRNGMRVKFTDSQRALETLAKVHALLVDRHVHTGEDGKPLFEGLTINIGKDE